MAFLIDRLAHIGITAQSESAIIPMLAPCRARTVAKRLRAQGVFVNAIEFPAVARGQERLRISMTSQHTRADIARLVSALEVAYRQEGLLRQRETAP